MSNYQANITKNNDDSFYALVVRVDLDGEQNVCHSYRGRHFKTLKAAQRSTEKHIVKLDA